MINEVDLPVSWEICNIFDISEPKQWKTIATKDLLETGYPVYGANGKIGFFNEYNHEDPALMITCRGATCGEIHISEPYAYINGNAMCLDNIPKLMNFKYLFYYLKNFNFSFVISGSAQPQITQSGLKAIDIPIPPVNEQNRIVDKIETLFSEVDAGIENLTLAKRQLGQYRQSLLKHAFEGKLTAKWREDYAEKHGKPLPSADELLKQIQAARQNYYDQQIADWEQAVKDWEEQGKECRKPRKPSALIKPEKNSSVNNYLIDCFWKKVSFSELYDIFIGSTPSRSIAEYWNGNINWVSSGEVTFSNIHFTKEKITQLGLVKTSTSVHPIGTVMLAMIGEGKTRGQASILKIEACHNQNTAALRVNNDLLSSEYLYFYLLYSYEMTRRIGSGNNQKALNKTVIQNMTIPICSFEEQTEIAQILEKQNNAIESSKQTLDKYLKKATLLKTSILHKAFQGKLVHQDPNDPPARELLAQIKAEREAKALAEKQAKQDKAASKSKAKAKSSKTPKKSKKDEQITLPL
jgi:type I restriction enzyme S subunit